MAGTKVEYKVVTATTYEDLMEKVDEMTGGRVSIQGRPGFWTFIGGVSMGVNDNGNPRTWSQALIYNTDHE